MPFAEKLGHAHRYGYWKGATQGKSLGIFVVATVALIIAI